MSQWKTKLSEFVRLKDRWEVGLLEVSFPAKVYDVFGGHFHYTVHRGLHDKKCVLRNGIYETITDLVTKITHAYKVVQKKELDRELLQIRYNLLTKCTMIVFTSNALDGTNVFFSKDLAAMLVFKANHNYWYPGTKSGEKPVHMTGGTANIVVYCDLLEHVMGTRHGGKRQGAAVAHSPQTDHRETTRKQC